MIFKFGGITMPKHEEEDFEEEDEDFDGDEDSEGESFYEED